MTEQEMRDLFREMREEPVPADSLARVRAGVDRRMRRVFPWKIVAALAVTGCLVAGYLLRPEKPVQQMSTREIARTVPSVPPEIPVRAAPRPKRVRPRPVETVPVLIRIETPDPEVVILLVN